MSQIAINTSQNVNIVFNLASIGERMLAFAIDMVIKLAYLTVVYFILYQLLGVASLLSDFDYWSVMAISVIIYLPVIIYSLVLESMMEGQTFGKKAMNIRVVKIDGYQAGFGDYFIRWMFRIIEANMFVIGLVSMIVSKNNQRLGGVASGTAVIQLKNKVNISHTILEQLKEDYTPTFPQVIALTDNDMRIIKDNYQKALRINDTQILRKLSEKILITLKLEKNQIQLSEKQFIGVVIKDYNYYTGKDA